MAGKGPETVEQLYTRMKERGVPEEDIEAFKEHILDEQHDLRSIQEDVEDREQSLFMDFFDENCQTEKTVLFDIIVAILNGEEPANNQPAKPKPEEKEEPAPKQPTATTKNNNSATKQPIATTATTSTETTSEPSKGAINKDTIDKKREVASKPNKPHFLTQFQKLYDEVTGYQQATDEQRQEQNTLIFNAAFIQIPDEVIIDEQYLEDIKGITYILEYNNCVVRPPTLPKSYVEFWHEYVEEEKPDFGSVRDDIRHNEGAVYDYLMENPPNDRILPVLEKVVDQLRYPKLQNKRKRKSRKDGWEDDIDKFFKSNMPDWYQYQQDFRQTELFKTCVLFMKNTEDVNFNIFELFPVIVDIYDRILFQPERYGLRKQIHKPYQVTGIDNKTSNPGELKKIHHFGHELMEKDQWVPMNKALVSFKQREPPNRSFFAKLETNASEPKPKPINDSLREYQQIGLSFLMFVKAFMCETGNGLETGYHVYKKSKGSKGVQYFGEDIEQILRNKKALRGDEQVTEAHINFHNENFPLQIDLVVIPKGAEKTAAYNDYAFELWHSSSPSAMKYEPASAYKTFVQDLKEKMFSGKQGAQQLYKLMVETFRKMVFYKENLLIKDPSDEESKLPEQVGAKKTQRRDDRYVMVIDRVANKLYFYPPHIYNGGKNDQIIHRKVIMKDRGTTQDTNEDNNNDSKEQQVGDSDPSEKDKDKDKDKEKDEEKNVIKDVPVRNRFSYIPHEYNDLTNWYLTSRCLVPSKGALKDDKNGRTCYGVRDFSFVLSAHFHIQRQWHRHPKLRIYQYFNGGGMRFLHVANDRKKHVEKINRVIKESSESKQEAYSYQYDQDLTEVWKDYFHDTANAMTTSQIDEYKVFDAIFDLYACDAQFFLWDNAVKRSMKKNKRFTAADSQ